MMVPLVPLLLLLIQAVSCRETIPVVLIDPRAVLHAGTITANPFHETTPNDFTDIIHDAIHLSDTILIFVEDRFSVEDITRRDSDGNPYKNIHLGFLEEKAKYLPSVVEPYKTLQRLLPPLETNVVYIKDTIMKPLSKNFKYHYLYFAEPFLSSETRIQRLRRHDALINQAYNTLSNDQSGPVLIFYTGRSNPMWKIGRSSSRPTPHLSDSVMLVSDKALIRLNGVVLEQGGMRTRLTEPSVSARSFALRRLSTRMLYHDDIELDFNFEYLHDSWIIESVVLLEGGEEVGRTNMGVGAPYDWSYYCSEPLIIVNTRDKSYVTISKYQIEPFRPKPRARSFQAEPSADKQEKPLADTDKGVTVPTPPPAGVEPPPQVQTADKGVEPTAEDTLTDPDVSAPEKSTFTNTQSCGTNFNCRILMGLFVASIVLGITLAGIMFLYDCKSNNRMDDVNQKPLVIIASL